MQSWAHSERRSKQACMYVLLGEYADGRLELLGCLTMDHSMPGSVKLWDVAAAAESHGLGVGDALLTAAKDAAAQAGCGLWLEACLLYTSPSPRDTRSSRMPSSA